MDIVSIVETLRRREYSPVDKMIDAIEAGNLSEGQVLAINRFLAQSLQAELGKDSGGRNVAVLKDGDDDL